MSARTPIDVRLIRLVHIAGLDVTVGRFLRQRCAWCGNILIDLDLSMVAVVVGTKEAPTDPRPATWGVGALVEVDGGYSSLVEHEAGDRLPKNACINVEKPLAADN